MAISQLLTLRLLLLLWAHKQGDCCDRNEGYTWDPQHGHTVMKTNLARATAERPMYNGDQH